MKGQRNLKDNPSKFSVLGEITKKAKSELRAKIVHLNFQEVRRCRIPFHEALLIELKEGQFVNAYDFYDELIQHDLTHSRVLTKDNKMMERIFTDLKECEYSHKEDEIEILVKLGRSVENTHWLADKIYSRALVMVKNYQLEKTRIDASAQYFYGRFLSEITSRLQESISCLSSAFDISYGVDDWTVEVDSGTRNFFKTVSSQIQNEDPETALKLATKSLKMIRRIRSDETLNLEVEAAIVIGNCFKTMGQLEKASLNFELAIQISKVDQNIESEMSALLKISECFKGDDEKYEAALIRAKDFAKLNSLKCGEGEVLQTLGKFSIEQKNSEKALECFQKAAKIYEKSKEMKKLQEIRCLIAPLNAQKTFNDLVDTILKCDKAVPGKNCFLERLLLWYDRKNPIKNHHHEAFQDVDEVTDVTEFVQKFYDPDEVVKL